MADEQDVLDAIHASKALESLYEIPPYNVRPWETVPPTKGLFRLFMGDYPTECPFQTVHGIYKGGDEPKGFVRQQCMTNCPHASLHVRKGEKKGIYRMTCAGGVTDIEVELRSNETIQIVQAGMAPV